ncbi:MAG TPA: folate family ECF transporter S component [Acholeplasmataceae bacterium]|jgi:ECF transporter S component (folate family)|nr:folate family ECF transporter S component [Acholeplasmataceae bacterium]
MEIDTIFKTPFTKLYWHLASKELKKTRSIILVSILIALSIVFETFGKMFPFKPFGRDIYLSFIPLSLIGMLFGPLVGILSGAISDILGFFIFNAGYPFFPGYTLSAMLSLLIYSIFFYRTKITVFKIFLAKFLVNFLINVLLGSLWMSLIIDKAFIVLLVGGALKNAILLPFEVLALYYVFLNLIPILKGFNLISLNIPNKITLF